MRKFSVKGFALIEILIVLAVLMVTAVGGVVVWKKRFSLAPTLTPTSTLTSPMPTVTPQVSPTITTEETIPASNETAGWKTHSNTYLGYSLKYPGDWQLIDRPIPQSGDWVYLTSVVITKASGCFGEKPAVGKPWCGASFTLNVGKNAESQTLEAWMRGHVGDLPAVFENIVVNGIRGVRFRQTTPSHPYLQTEDKAGTVGFARNKMVFILRYRVSGPDPGDSLFNQLELILSTFKFLPLAPGAEEQIQTTAQCTRENGIDTCPQGYVCYWSWECPKGVKDCGLPTGDFLCHKKCQTDSDCPSSMPFCKEVSLFRGDYGGFYRMCMK